MNDLDMFTPRSLASASRTNLFFLIFNSLLFLVITPLTLKNMGVEAFGVWMVLLAVAQFSNLASFGAGSAAEKFTAQASGQGRSEEFSTTVTFSYLFMAAMGVMIGTFLWVFRWNIAGVIEAGRFSIRDDISSSVGLFALALLPQFLTLVSRGIFLGLVMNFWAGFFDSLQTTGMWIGVFFLTGRQASFTQLGGWVLGLSWIVCLSSVLVLVRVFHEHNFRIGINLSMTRKFLHQSVMTWFSSLGITLFQTVDRIIVGYFLGPGFAGVYSLASSVALRINILLGQFTQVLTPLASRWQADGYNNRIIIVYRKFLRFSSWVLFFIAAVLVLWMPEILTAWISSDFSARYADVFKVMVVVYSLFSLSRPAQQVLNGLGLAEKPARTFLISGIMTLVAILAGARWFGLIGAAAGNLVFAGTLALHISLAKYLRLPAFGWLNETIPSCALSILLLVLNLIFHFEIIASAAVTCSLLAALAIAGYKNKFELFNISHLYNHLV